MENWLHGRYIADAASMALMALGGRNSGKSYTLFGGDVGDYDQRGVIPRLIHEIFNPRTLRAHFMKINVCLLDGENVVDMLVTPPKPHNAAECICNSHTLGQVLLQIQEAICHSAVEAIELLMKALIAVSMYSLNTVNALHALHTVVQIQWLGPSASSVTLDSPIYERVNKPVYPDNASVDTKMTDDPSTAGPTRKAPATHWYQLTAVEVAATEFPPIIPTAMDRLSTFGMQFTSTRLLIDMCRKCPNTKFLNQLNCINQSVLTWLIQGPLFMVRSVPVHLLLLLFFFFSCTL